MKLLTVRNVILIVVVAVLGRIVLSPVVNRIEGNGASGSPPAAG